MLAPYLNYVMTQTGNQRYNDLVLRLIFAFIGAHIVTEFGGNEPWLNRLFTREYFIEFGSTLAITLLIVQLVYWATIILDRHFDWYEKPLQRTLLQALLGILVPAIITFALATLYFAAYGVNILRTNYHIYALPFIVALIAIFNVYYLVRYLLGERSRYRKLAEQHALAASGSPELLPATGKAETFLVRTPTHSFPVDVASIAYFYRDQNSVYLRLFDGGDYILAQSLDTIEERLGNRQFFRVARHMIANYNAIKAYHPLPYGKLGLTIRPAYKEEVSVSKPLARSFKLWYDRQGVSSVNAKSH